MRVYERYFRFVIFWRIAQLLILAHLWLISTAGFEAIVFILLLLIVMSIRIRFSIPKWSFLIEIVLCIVFIPYFPFALYGLAIAIFEAAIVGKWWLIFPMTIFMITYPAFDITLIWYSLLTVLVGSFTYQSMKERKQLEKTLDKERKEKHELEQIKMELLEAYFEVEKAAELKERNRISRELHDHLGHDLTGALLAIQAYEQVENENQAHSLLEQVKIRLSRSTTRLRNTVHNLTPVTYIGVDRLQRIVADSEPLLIEFQYNGNVDNVSSQYWLMLEACLKEAITNVSKYSNATKTKVELDITETLVRLKIHDNGTITQKSVNGSGLRSLQLRARMLKGSFTIDRQNGYLLVCVLPIQRRGK